MEQEGEMRIYISGPMTGMPDSNISAFNAAAERLRAEGHFVINPTNLSAMFGTSEEIEKSFSALYGLPKEEVFKRAIFFPIDTILAKSIMDADLAAVRSCDAIYLLRGWESSRGAKKELAEAIKYGLEVRQEGGDECDTPE